MKDKTLEMIKNITITEIYNVLDKLAKLYELKEKYKNAETILERGNLHNALVQIAILEERHDDLIREYKICIKAE